MPESVFWRSRRGGGDLTDKEVPAAARELFETWTSFIQEPPFPEWNEEEASQSGGIDIGSEQREAWEKLTCLMAEPGAGQDRLAMMLCALGRGVGGPELARILLSAWRSEAVDLPAGAEAEPRKEPEGPMPEWKERLPTQPYAQWVQGVWALKAFGAAKKPDATDKRLAEMNGALAALEVARGHLEGLEGMETGVAKAHCQGHRESLRLIQVQLRELAGKEDF